MPAFAAARAAKWLKRIGWAIGPLAAGVMAGEFTKRNTNTNEDLFIPGEPFQRPEQAGQIIAAAGDAVAFLGKAHQRGRA